MALALTRARKAVLKRDIPAYVERTPKFAPLARFEMILEWHKSLDKSPRIQRMGFKASGSFIDVVAEAQRLTRMLNSCYGRTLPEINNSEFCRIIAVYEEKAFVDYSAEPLYNSKEKNKAVQKHVDAIKAYDKTESTKIPRNSIRTVRVQ